LSTLAGRYEITQTLGGGNFGVTYLARDILQPSKPLCVVKQLRPNQSHPRVVEFFQKEAALLESLGKHAQIPQLLAHFNQDQHLYIVQEFIEGQDLSREIVPGKQLSEGYASKLLQDVLEVLSFVHSQGVIHRDIKPQNLMRRSQDGKIFLIDFGAVKELGTLMVNTQGGVNSSVVIGTAGYMPNEQKNGKPCLGSDVYAVGMTIIQALTGVLPFDLQEDPLTGEVIWRQQAQVSDHLADVLTKMVRRHHSLRYAKAAEALQDLISQPSPPITPTVVVNPAKQAYLQEATVRAQQGQGNFSVFAQRILESKRVELGLSADEAQEINEQVLNPYREYERKLQEYEQALIDAMKQQYPFSQAMQKDLLDYQQYLGLRDEDIAAIQARVFPQSKPPVVIQNFVPQTPQPKPAPKSPPVIQNVVTPTPQPQPTPKSPPVIQTQTFEFETATVRKSKGFFGLGKSHDIDIQRCRGRAEYFVETLDKTIVLEMVAIPGGQFLMGSPENEQERSSNESPQHTVTVPPFFMGKFPVTQAQWQVVANFAKVNIYLNPDPSYFKGANRPVENVSWDEVVEFCARLTQKTGKTYRLPSEAEWEYACRGATTTPFYFGETITTDLVNYNGNYTYGDAPKGEYRKQTTDVGQFPANPFGLFNMHGNIWEWCKDVYNNTYQGASIDGSAWFKGSNNNSKLLRGGSWYDDPGGCRSANRRGYPPVSRSNLIGFRVVLVLV
jgi:eukaryotic-like serine/threonine-protein kinase